MDVGAYMVCPSTLNRQAAPMNAVFNALGFRDASSYNPSAPDNRVLYGVGRARIMPGALVLHMLVRLSMTELNINQPNHCATLRVLYKSGRPLLLYLWETLQQPPETSPRSWTIGYPRPEGFSINIKATCLVCLASVGFRCLRHRLPSRYPAMPPNA